MPAFSQVYKIYTFSYSSPLTHQHIFKAKNSHENDKSWDKMLKVYENQIFLAIDPTPPPPPFRKYFVHL